MLGILIIIEVEIYVGSRSRLIRKEHSSLKEEFLFLNIAFMEFWFHQNEGVFNQFPLVMLKRIFGSSCF